MAECDPLCVCFYKLSSSILAVGRLVASVQAISDVLLSEPHKICQISLSVLILVQNTQLMDCGSWHLFPVARSPLYSMQPATYYFVFSTPLQHLFNIRLLIPAILFSTEESDIASFWRFWFALSDGDDLWTSFVFIHYLYITFGKCLIWFLYYFTGWGHYFLIDFQNTCTPF